MTISGQNQTSPGGTAGTIDQAGSHRLARVLKSPWAGGIAILILALTMRMLHIQEAVKSPLMHDNIPMIDSQYYDKVAREVAEGDLLGDEVFYLAPLYPYTMAISYRIFRSETADGKYVYNVDIIRYLQCVMGGLSCLLLYLIGLSIMGRGVGLLAGAIASVYGVYIYYDGIIMPSCLILFLHLLALLLLIIAQRRGSGLWWLISGTAIGLCAVAHGTALLIMMGLLLWIWIGFPGTNNRTKLKRSALILAGFMPIIATVTIRNYVVGKDIVLLTSNGGKNFYIGNNPRATGTFAFCKFKIWGSDLDYYLRDIKRTSNDATPSGMSRIIAGEAWKFIRKQPLAETKLLARKFTMLFNAFEISISDNFYFARRYSRILSWSFIGFGVIGPIGLLGLFYQLKQWRKYFILLVFIAAQAGAFTIMFILSRYRLLFVACLILFAAKQLTWWWGRLQEKQYRRLVFSLIPLAVCVLWVHCPLNGFDKTRGFGQQHASVAKAYLAYGETEKAITEFQKALQSNFDPWDDNIRRVKCYWSLGNLYIHQQQWPQAILICEGLLAQYQQWESTPTTQAAIRQIQQRLIYLKKMTPQTSGKNI